MIINFQEIDNKLSILNFNRDLDFTSKRIYLLKISNNDQKRGFHAHKKLSQIFVLIKGAFSIKLLNCNEEKNFLINNPKKALYLPHGYWREIFPEENTEILVIASDNFYEADYIRDKEEFLDWSKKNREIYE